jgi:hypothetical protein
MGGVAEEGCGDGAGVRRAPSCEQRRGVEVVFRVCGCRIFGVRLIPACIRYCSTIQPHSAQPGAARLRIAGASLFSFMCVQPCLHGNETIIAHHTHPLPCPVRAVMQVGMSAAAFVEHFKPFVADCTYDEDEDSLR